MKIQCKGGNEPPKVRLFLQHMIDDSCLKNHRLMFFSSQETNFKSSTEKDWHCNTQFKKETPATKLDNQ